MNNKKENKGSTEEKASTTKAQASLKQGKIFRQWSESYLEANNAAWMEALYEDYLHDPKSVELHWQEYFASLGDEDVQTEEKSHGLMREYFRHWGKQINLLSCSESHAIRDYELKQIQVLQLINAYRFRGHQVARLNPLANSEIAPIGELSLDYHGLSKEDLVVEFDTGSLAGEERISLETIYAKINKTYCGFLGAEYMHIIETTEKRWIQQRLESVESTPEYNITEKKHILQRLTAAEELERYLHRKYVGQKRFSLEGAESLVPLLDTLIQRASLYHVKETVIGMAHRGRLNVLVNILGKKPVELFREFEGSSSVGLSGDVKYHMGFSSDIKLRDHAAMHLNLAFNPSHLEIVAPVVEGSVRARQQRWGDSKGEQVIPVQIHGDAAFSGQGVVMETLQMSQSRGYSTKGSIHIIINNQIGFTTSKQQDARSTLYCTDIARMVEAPIFHVNADQPESVVFAAQLAMDYRMRFHKDVVIDLVCYRRHGHNEADEPAVTQPRMYATIRKLKTTCQLYADALYEQGIIDASYPQTLIDEYIAELEAGDKVLNRLDPHSDYTYAFDWHPYLDKPLQEQVDTSIPLSVLQDLAAKLEQLPPDFVVHPRVAKILADRHKMTAGAQAADWGYAETLAYAVLLTQGYGVRLSGQDAGRGTFFHRHAVWHNQLHKEAWVPLRNLGSEQANFLVIDSLLSEEAVLAFEYGYASTDPNTLVIWEAQFGDFANGAQVVIDQFISAGEQKWGRLTGLVMFLPHGYEGQGPEHSSARLERYLQLCAQENMQVCVPSTPAQIFHLLCRQMLRSCRKPLIILTPKSLLRHKLAVSNLEDFTTGKFMSVIPDGEVQAKKVKRVVLCSGKIYYELYLHRQQLKRQTIAILRVEELYPFPHTVLKDLLQTYPDLQEIFWCQEEPQNQGAWMAIYPALQALPEVGQCVSYIGRDAAAAPSVGSARVHAEKQKELLDRALSVPQ